MDEHVDEPTDDAGDDPVLAAAGARLREASRPVSPARVEAAVLRRRARRRGVAAAAALVAAGVLGGLVVADIGSDPDGEVAGGPGTPAPIEVERLLASLDDQPVDPRDVELTSAVETFPDCGALMGELRRVGAEHVGSRGFGGFDRFLPVGASIEEQGDMTGYSADDSGASRQAPTTVGPAAGTGGDGGVTLGTNVQVAGVDELDVVKAVGALVYDLDGRGALRITDAAAGRVLSTLDVTPAADDEDGGEPQVSELLVADGTVVLFGTEVEVSEPVAGDPSATRAATEFLTVTFVDASDPAAPAVTDRVRVEGSLVSARLVDGEVRMVTTSHMADLGFVSPTTPASVAKALEQNRRSVASSTAPDWVPDWQRDGAEPEPLVPCDRVHVPSTFAGVAMTSMVTFPAGADRFAPTATSFLAPATTLYAGLDRVAISSEVWVDPIDRERLEFDDWQTAIHEFAFAGDGPPTYVGSGIVDGSTVGQFAFGEVGEALAVVTTTGVPWRQDPEVAVDLTLLRPDDEGGLVEAARVEDLAEGRGEVAAVRYVPGRVLVSTGLFGREVHVIDVADPAAPRRAGSVTVPGTVGYFHPLPDDRALLVGSRFDMVGEGDDRQGRSWVQAHLLDVADPDAPRIVGTWERPWVTDEVAYDHHAFTWWPDRDLALWGLRVEDPTDRDRLNEALVLRADGGLAEVAVPTASKPDQVAPPCPEVPVPEPEIADAIGSDGRVLHCDDPARREVVWPRYQCYWAADDLVAQYVPEDQRTGSYHVCSPAPPPTVRRVLVVAGTPYLYTDQTLERLDPETFASVAVTFHPSSQW